MSTLVAQTISNGSVSTSSANVIQGCAKAWVNFIGSSSTINASYNTSSVTRNGTGDYTVNFTNAFADNKYAWTSGTTNSAGSGVNSYLYGYGSATQTTSSLRINVNQAGLGLVDGNPVCIAIFR